MLGLLLTMTLAADAREPHTLEIGVGTLPACATENATPPCKLVTHAKAHGDHRLPRRLLVSWDLIATHRRWGHLDVSAAQETLRLDASLALGVFWSWDWGDMRLYAGPSIEHVRALGSQRAGEPLGVAWLDPMAGRTDRGAAWTDLGLVVGNDLDWPVGPVRIGFRWRVRFGADLAGGAPPGVTPGMDAWELHAASLSAPLTGAVGCYVELGWTNQFSIPTQPPQFRVAPWLIAGLQVRLGRSAGDSAPTR